MGLHTTVALKFIVGVVIHTLVRIGVCECVCVHNHADVCMLHVRVLVLSELVDFAATSPLLFPPSQQHCNWSLKGRALQLACDVVLNVAVGSPQCGTCMTA